MSSIWKYKYFVDVIENQSFTLAGNINYVSQTAISQNISSLEKTLGGKLIHRDKGKINPTELGEIVYRRSKEMLEIEELMLREAEHLKSEVKLRIGVDSSINRKMWFMVEKVYGDYFLDRDILFGKLDCVSAVKMFENRDIDLFLSYDSEYLNGLSGMVTVPLKRQKLGVCVAKQTTIPSGAVTLDDLKGHRIYYSNQYPHSIQKEAEKYLQNDCSFVYAGNIDTINLKVEFNDGCVFVDSEYYSCDEGSEIRELSGYDKECELRVYYRLDSNKYDVPVFIQKLSEEINR